MQFKIFSLLFIISSLVGKKSYSKSNGLFCSIIKSKFRFDSFIFTKSNKHSLKSKKDTNFFLLYFFSINLLHGSKSKHKRIESSLNTFLDVLKSISILLGFFDDFFR